jgi:hypothetical protein
MQMLTNMTEYVIVLLAVFGLSYLDERLFSPVFALVRLICVFVVLLVLSYMLVPGSFESVAVRSIATGYVFMRARSVTPRSWLLWK